MNVHRPGPATEPPDIHAAFGRRIAGMLAGPVGGDGLPPPFAISVAPPRPGLDCDVLVRVALGSGGPPSESAAHRLARQTEREADVASAAVAGPGLVCVTLTADGRASALAALLRRGPRDPAGRSSGTAFADAVARSRDDEASLVQARAAALADLFAEPDPAGLERRGRHPVGSVRVLAGRGAAGRSSGGLREALDVVGLDALRFALTAARPTASLVLDPGRLAERSRGNPLFWIRYVHARARRAPRDGAMAGLDIVPAAGLPAGGLARLQSPAEIAAVRAILRHDHLITRCATIRSAHLVAAHLSSLATVVHDLWDASKDQPQLRFLNQEQRDLAEARFVLVTACTLVLSSGLGIFGVSAPDEML